MPLRTTRDVPLAADAGQATEGTAPAVSGPAAIARYLKGLPGSPGVYRMLDAGGTVIYVGKARNLKARVTSYARGGQHTNRIARMIAATTAMEFVTVRTEAEALLLEANLIKRFRPRFNVLLRDDKSFPYILIARDHKAPQILKHRGARNRKGDYFGPFASAGAVNRTINMLERAFLLRSCSDPVFESRTRPCLLFQIKRCSAPCTGEIGLEDYGALVEEATRFLKGESQNARQMYQRLMQEAAESLDYEQAAKFRNRLWALAHVTADQAINPEGIEEADVFAAYQEGGQTCIQVFFFRAGQNWGNRAYFPRADRSLRRRGGAGELHRPILRRQAGAAPDPAVARFARRRLAERGAVDQGRAQGRGARCPSAAARPASSSTPRRMPARRWDAGWPRAPRSASCWRGCASASTCAATPRRIEVYDNSHIQGSNAVGAMIVAGADGFMKSHYRKFNIKSADLTPGDDYAMMREVLTRRFRRLASAPEGVRPSGSDTRTNRRARDQRWCQTSGLIRRRHVQRRLTDPEGLTPPGSKRRVRPRCRSAAPMRWRSACCAPMPSEPEEAVAEEFPDRPDVVLIDGGRGQLGVAQEVLRELGIDDVALIGVAKGPDRDAGREHFHRPGHDRSMMLEPRDPVLYFVQRLRDEAHRFAIGTHRAKRSKAIGANPLDEIAGIGPSRKRALLKHFGSAKAVSRAGTEDLQAVEGISAQMAQAIYDFFHERSE